MKEIQVYTYAIADPTTSLHKTTVVPTKEETFRAALGRGIALAITEFIIVKELDLYNHQFLVRVIQ